MSFAQALRYFLREAWVSLVRSWKVSLLAILTIAVSLFIGGLLLLTTTNVSQVVEDWRTRAKVLIYLDPAVPPAAVNELRKEVEALPWVRSVELTDAEAARNRFQETFPSLAELAEGWDEEPLPASLEIEFDPVTMGKAELESWSESMRGRPYVELVDDDRDWLAQLTTLIAVARGVGLSLGVLLLAAAVFTIASVIRLTAYLYQEEIAIMRIVGATEFFIRGPFWVEGFLQGLLGGGLALAGLYGTFLALRSQYAVSPWGQLLLAEFVSAPHQALMLLVGAAAGLAGAVLSLRRERLVQGPVADDELP